jgi:prepilin-type N-terminal cleavage/methylation domain-containing protein
MEWECKKNAGFTLIELTVVILILGLIYGIVVPKFEDITGLKIKAVAMKVAAFVNLGYNEAVSKNKKIRLVFDFGEDSDRIWAEEWVVKSPQELLKLKSSGGDDEDKLTLTEKEELEKAPKGSYNQVSDKLAAKFELPDYVRIKGIYIANDEKLIDRDTIAAERKDVGNKGDLPYASIVFLPSGFTQNAVIYLSDKKERVYSIKVNPITGRPTVVDSYVEPKNL